MMSTEENPFEGLDLSSPVDPGKKKADDTDKKKAPAKAPAKRRTAEKPKKGKPDFSAVVSEQIAISAQHGQVIGTIDANGVAVPVLRLSLVGWLGTPPVEIVASDLDDIRAVLDELEGKI